MKKSTKIITTAIALVLVMGFMVVGIMAATSATASITAQVNWTAVQGVSFQIHGWTERSKEDYESRSDEENEFDNNPYGMDKEYSMFERNHRMTSVSVDTTTTNSDAAGMVRNFNASFYDKTNDGVNNPESIYYIYSFQNGLWNQEGAIGRALKCTLTKYPQSTANVKVEFKFVRGTGLLARNFTNYIESGQLEEMSTTPPGSMEFGTGDFDLFCIKLTLLTPDQSLNSFDASVGFSVSLSE